MSDFITSPVGPFPPLPDPVPPFPAPLPAPHPVELIPRPEVIWPRPPFHFRSVRCGCWLLNYTPSASLLVTYDGTLRVECHADGRTASGDLYQRRVLLLPVPRPLPPIVGPPVPARPIQAPPPSPAAGIPVLPRGQYRYYLRVTQILDGQRRRADLPVLVLRRCALIGRRGAVRGQLPPHPLAGGGQPLDGGAGPPWCGLAVTPLPRRRSDS